MQLPCPSLKVCIIFQFAWHLFWYFFFEENQLNEVEMSFLKDVSKGTSHCGIILLNNPVGTKQPQTTMSDLRHAGCPPGVHRYHFFHVTFAIPCFQHSSSCACLLPLLRSSSSTTACSTHSIFQHRSSLVFLKLDGSMRRWCVKVPSNWTRHAASNHFRPRATLLR